NCFPLSMSQSAYGLVPGLRGLSRRTELGWQVGTIYLSTSTRATTPSRHTTINSLVNEQGKQATACGRDARAADSRMHVLGPRRNQSIWDRETPARRPGRTSAAA